MLHSENISTYTKCVTNISETKWNNLKISFVLSSFELTYYQMWVTSIHRKYVDASLDRIHCVL